MNPVLAHRQLKCDLCIVEADFPALLPLLPPPVTEKTLS